MKKILVFLGAVILVLSCKKDNNDDLLIDPRDGEIYATVKIGGQTWMAENLRYNVPGSYPDSKYGCLYTWTAAMGIDSSNVNTWGGSDFMHQGICPQGWHIPSDAEWQVLADILGGDAIAGSMMKSAIDWDGNNSSGFSALPAGFYYLHYGPLQAHHSGIKVRGSQAYFWSSTEADSRYAQYRSLCSDSTELYRFSKKKDDGLSCRCIKD